MKYRRLFSIEVEHAFYPDMPCREVSIEPRSPHPSGQRALDRFRMIARQRPGGIEVATLVGADDLPVVTIPNDLVLGFDMRVSGQDFSLFTDLTDWAGLAQPIYQIDQDDLVLGDEAGPDASARPHDVKAVIEIDGIAASWLDTQPKKFSVSFTAKTYNWVYYLVTHQTGTPSIVNPTSPSFGVTELTSVQALADPIVAATFERMSDPDPPKCFRLVSSQPIPASKLPLRNLELHLVIDADPLNDEVLVSELPNPSLRNRQAPLVPGDPDSLFHVVEY